MGEDGEKVMSWSEIYKHLRKHHFAVYAPGQHKGLCTEPYIVLKNNGSIPVYGVADRQYELLVYYPADRYSEMEGYVDLVKYAMAELWPTVSMVDDEAPHYLDDDVKGYMTSMIYRAPKVAKYIYGGK